MRTRLACSLDREPPVAPTDPLARVIGPRDGPALAELMLAAYRGTIDDAGEGPAEAMAEVERFLSGAYGPANLTASDVTERQGRLVSATLVTMMEGLPLIAFSMTAPEWKRRGLARAGLLRAMHRLRDCGHPSVRLVVTRGNTPAEALYAQLGFAPDPV
ncbi:MAG: GNAT family N-acetyltransferase [Phycisphaerales bacterium]|nr:GNAT family N-acetyltransferase [Phycisphaerales bacterium]